MGAAVSLWSVAPGIGTVMILLIAMAFVMLGKNNHRKEVYRRHIEYIAQPWGGSVAAGYVTPGWYFWDETSAYCHGPFRSRRAAYRGLCKYARSL